MDIKKLHSLFLNSTGICTDTRKLKEGQLFFSLKGENFDGNKYAQNAIKKGASYAIIDNKEYLAEQTILTKDVLTKLQELANYHRKHLGIKIIGLTGSNGKTTTKELINAVLETEYKTKATIGNLNNHIGVPLTLLSMTNNTEIGIVEMGANHLKEIALLSKISEPNYGYITNIGKAHLEGFGSKENILIAKTELYKNIESSNGTIFINSDDEKLSKKAVDLKKIKFSQTEKDGFAISHLESDPFVKIKYNDTIITSKLIGDYNYTNIAASIAIGLHFNIKIENIKKAIENYTPTINRSQLIKTNNSNNIILDAYNANPSSMEVALNHFFKEKTTHNKVLILGDMFELGEFSREEHQSIVNKISQNSIITKTYLAGENFYNTSVENNKIEKFRTSEDLINHLKKLRINDSKILVKGSRGMKLEQCLEVL